MTPENFCYWLQGFMELTNPNVLNENQVKILKEHLSLVFDKVTSDIDPNPDWVKAMPPPTNSKPGLVSMC